MRKIFKPTVSRISSFLILVSIVLTGCRAETSIPDLEKAPRINPSIQLPAVLKDWPALNIRNPGVPDDFDLVAENRDLRLYLRQKTSAIIVEDKRSGKLWNSTPADLGENKAITTAWRRQIESPVVATYVDPERSQAKLVRPDRVELKYQPVESGVSTHYLYPTYNLEFNVLYTLRDDCLEVTLPENSIVEGGGNGLVTVDLMSFFGATHDGDQGYIVYPDGAGSLMHYTTPHPDVVQKLAHPVYGEDTISGGYTYQGPGVFHEQVVMPVFGLVKDDAGFVAFITQGDFDAEIAVARSGKGINYNHVWTQSVFRRQGRFSITGGQPAWLYQPDRTTGDRQIRYCFLNGSNANYVGMATRYRDFLIKERGAQRLSENPPLVNIILFMGVERKTWFLRDMIPMTTFDDARNIIADLSQAGVKRIDVTLWNWNRGGTGSLYPQHLPVDSSLGKEEKLKLLAADLNSRGQKLFLEDNYLEAAPGSHGVMPYLDVMRGVDGLPVGDSERGYLLNPQISIRDFVLKDYPTIKTLGANGMMLDALASLTLPDKNPLYPLSRESYAASWMQLAKIVRKEYGAVALSGSNIYAVPYADRLDFVTMDSTHYDIFDEVVPLYQIATHGLVVYSGQPFNLISDGKRMFLRHIEYGAAPVFILTQENSAKLFRTNANSIWSSQYDFWRDEVIHQYQVMEDLAPLVNQFIVGHQRLAKGVYQTEYEDGTKVIVNYNAQPFTDGSVSIPPQDFIVLRGEK